MNRRADRDLGPDQPRRLGPTWYNSVVSQWPVYGHARGDPPMSFASTITPDEIEQAARENSLAMIRQTIPDDLLYEVVDGQIVEKRMGARETRNRNNSGCFSFSVCSGASFGSSHRRTHVPAQPRERPSASTRRCFRLHMRAGHYTAGFPRVSPGTWSPTSPSRLSVRATQLMKFRRNFTSTLMPV